MFLNVVLIFWWKIASKKEKNAVPKSKKKVTVTKISPTSDYIDDDDDALKMVKFYRFHFGILCVFSVYLSENSLI